MAVGQGNAPRLLASKATLLLLQQPTIWSLHTESNCNLSITSAL